MGEVYVARQGGNSSTSAGKTQHAEVQPAWQRPCYANISISHDAIIEGLRLVPGMSPLGRDLVRKRQDCFLSDCSQLLVLISRTIEALIVQNFPPELHRGSSIVDNKAFARSHSHGADDGTHKSISVAGALADFKGFRKHRWIIEIDAEMLGTCIANSTTA